jgi:hypothetical protein
METTINISKTNVLNNVFGNPATEKQVSYLRVQKFKNDTHKSQPAAIFKAKDGSILYNNSSYKGNNNHIVDSLVEAMKRRNP